MTKFRLKIDFSDFYEDERRLAYVLVNLEWGHVVELEEHVQMLFEMPQVRFITEDGVFIPSKESIEVVKGCTFLKAFVPKTAKKKKVKRHESEEEADGYVVVGDKRKHTANGSISSSTPNGPVEKKRKPNFESAAPLESPSPKGAVTSTNNSPESDKTSSDLSKSADAKEETVKTRKRKRKPKKKRPSCEEKSTRLSCVPVPISSSTLRLSKSMSTPMGKHVRFDEAASLEEEDATLVQEDSEIGGRCVVFRSRLGQSDSLQPREIEAEDTLQKPKIQIHENILLVEGKSSSDDCDNTSVIEIEDSLLKVPNEQMEGVEEPDLSIVDEVPLASELLDDLPETEG